MCFSGECYHEKIKPSMTKVDDHRNVPHSIEMVELTDGNSLNVELLMERRRSIDTPPTSASYLQVTR